MIRDRASVEQAMSLSRVVAIVGWLGAGSIAIASIAAALAYSGHQGEAYSPLTHFVSELGEPGVSALAPVFDAGLIAGGACLAVFMIGLAAHLPGFYRWGIACLGAIAGVSGALVGVFPMTVRPTHAMFALTFFDTAWVAVGLFTLYVLVRGPAGFPRRLALPGAVTIVAFVVFLLDTRFELAAGGAALETPAVRPDPSAMPSLEWLTLIAIVAWVTVVATSLWRVAGEPDVASAGGGRAR